MQCPQSCTHACVCARGRVHVDGAFTAAPRFTAPIPDSQDALPYHFLVHGCVGFNYGLQAEAAPKHSWSYFPSLAAEEVIAFKAYDSMPPTMPPIHQAAHQAPEAEAAATAAAAKAAAKAAATVAAVPAAEAAATAAGCDAIQRPCWCFHAAVDDPMVQEGCPPRESVEVRVVLAFE